MIEAIAFDLGRVLFDFDYAIALRRLKGRINAPHAQVIEELFYKNFALEFEKGLVSGRKFYEKFKNKFGVDIGHDEFIVIWNEIFFPMPEVIDFAAKLSQHYPLYMISNINEWHFNYLYAKYPAVFDIFNKLVLSYKVKSVKPEKKIYAELKKMAGCKYSQIVYIDDRPDLITPARKLSLNCVQFRNLKQATQELKKYKIAV
jgi:putative hydrolase of the HAD superfamily